MLRIIKSVIFLGSWALDVLYMCLLTATLHLQICPKMSRSHLPIFPAELYLVNGI